MSFFWRQVVSRSPSKNIAAPAYENGWNALNQLIRGDYSWNGNEPNVVYARRGGRFYDFSGVSGLDCAEDSRAFAVTDFDGDGNLDVLLKSRWGLRCARSETHGERAATPSRSNCGERSPIATPLARVWKWRCAGRADGQDASGRVRLSFAAHQAAAFRVGRFREARRKIRIRWPSGMTQQFENLSAGFRYQIVEGSSEMKRVPFLPREALQPPRRVTGENQPRFEPTWLLEPVPLPEPPKGRDSCAWSPDRARCALRRAIQIVDLAAAPPDRAPVMPCSRRTCSTIG